MEKFDIFLIFAQNIDCVYTLEPPRRGGSNECPQYMFWIICFIVYLDVLDYMFYILFGAKIRKIGIPLQTQVLLYKSGVQGGIHYTDMFS